MEASNLNRARCPGNALGRAARWGAALAILAAAAPAAAQNLDMGDTYRALDARAVRVVTEFGSATATTDRLGDGTLVTELRSPRGALLARLTVPPAGALSLETGELALGQGTVDPPSFAPTTDWANLQAFGLWRDLREVRRRSGLPADAAQLTWSGAFLRPWTAVGGDLAAAEHGARLEAEALSVSALFEAEDGSTVSATSVRSKELAPVENDGSTTYFATFTTTLVDAASGQQLGVLRWFEDEQVYSWSLPGLTEGWVDPERIGKPLPFEPDLAWGNVQALGFLQSHRALVLANLQGPTANNTVGCDGLHWLDNTILRPCCDDHDRCYEKHGCTASSWWVIGSSWSCIRCNIAVVFCFLTGGGGGGGGGPGGGGGGGGGGCVVYGAGWCPPECMSCTRIYY